MRDLYRLPPVRPLQSAKADLPALRVALSAAQLSFDEAPAIDCDGREGFDPAFDAQRLGKQMLGVLRCLKRGGWWTLRQLRDEAGGSEAGVSARLRDLKKARYGRRVIEKRRVGDSGLWEYSLRLD